MRCVFIIVLRSLIVLLWPQTDTFFWSACNISCTTIMLFEVEKRSDHKIKKEIETQVSGWISLRGGIKFFLGLSPKSETPPPSRYI